MSCHDRYICTNTSQFKHHRIGVFKISVEQSFPPHVDALDVLVGPVSKRSARILSALLREYVLCVSNVYVSLQQASKWGIYCFCGSFT